MDARGERAEILDPGLCLVGRRIQQLSGAFGFRLPLLLGELQVDDDVDELLLGPIVEIPGDLAACRVAGLDRPPSRW